MIAGLDMRKKRVTCFLKNHSIATKYIFSWLLFILCFKFYEYMFVLKFLSLKKNLETYKQKVPC